MRMHWIRFVAALVAAVSATLALTVPASAGSGGQLRLEPAWYDGFEVTFLQPSLFSEKPNGGVFACFGLGPDLSAVDRPTAPLYVIIDGTATQDHCDGDEDDLRHDHVLSVAPGDSGYTGAWTLVVLVEGEPGSVDLATDPFTSAAEVLDAISAGILVDVTSALTSAPVTMVAPVIARS